MTDPIGTLTDKDFEDDDENSGAGDGIPDLVNTNTDFATRLVLMVVYTVHFMVLKKLKVVQTQLYSKLVIVSKMVTYHLSMQQSPLQVD